jgi:uncharacterized MnhB-related membrane protein
VREGLNLWPVDRALALTNALIGGELQVCVAAMIAQREDVHP